MTSDPSPFIQHTLEYRWVTIARQVITENAFSGEIAHDLESLVQELMEGVVRPLKPDGGADLARWSADLEPLLGQSWRSIPWYAAEAYFYRRILEATRYFSSGIDPFERQKRSSLETGQEVVGLIGKQLTETLDRQADGTMLLHAALWGNQADLSLRPTSAPAADHQNLGDYQQAGILVDDTPGAIDRWKSVNRLDLIADNVGVELVADLALVDFLLTRAIASTVYLHLKSHPTFVSDATVSDVQQTLTKLAVHPDVTVQGLVQRITDYLVAGRLHLRDHEFWTSPLVFWQMPLDLRQTLAAADGVIIKGDANYRRLLGDRHWRFTTAIAEIVCYFPAPLLALRTLKSEIVVGLQPDQVESTRQQDPDWLTNGRWGVVQFVDLLGSASG